MPNLRMLQAPSTARHGSTSVSGDFRSTVCDHVFAADFAYVDDYDGSSQPYLMTVLSIRCERELTKCWS